MPRTFAHPVAHVCRVCGRPAQVDDLCGRHGGSVGLVVQTEDLSRTMRAGLRLVVTAAVATMALGGLVAIVGGSLTGREDADGPSRTAGLAMMLAGVAMLVVAMYASQLRRWAVALATVSCALLALATIAVLVVTAPASSFRTLILLTTILPLAVAAVLTAVWWAMESDPPEAEAAPRGAGAAA
ncbi:MAG TPA: hypothetical protein VFO60_03020 [Candidatus Dormibacteraeota bacterium]|nr:hypothetical protein [Candidatus Dormibacteraeota bacterium]